MKEQNHRPVVEQNDQKAELIAAYRESGLGLRRFAQERGIPPGRLHYWVYQKNPESKPAVPAKTTRPLLQEFQLAAGSSLVENWAAEVRLAGGVSVRFSGSAAPGWIGAIIHSLQRPC